MPGHVDRRQRRRGEFRQARYAIYFVKVPKLIVSRDKGNSQVHRAHNKGGKPVTQYKIDGEVITEGNRCDYALFTEEEGNKQAFLIELKGSDLTMAAMQIEATEKVLKNALMGYSMNYRIVANKCKTQEIHHSSFQKYKLKWKKKLKYKTGEMDEDI